MNTTHDLIIADARQMTAAQTASVHLVVTSPPYPMIAMWDPCFDQLAPRSTAHLEAGRGNEAFEAMHVALDAVWRECWRVLVPGGFACINVGDATRSVAGSFQLYPNHVRIVSAMGRLGFTVLPDILWRKPTNAPNKFMGSGMLPAGAYVTYEHEYILIFRKGDKRQFPTPESRAARARSAYFWEERNLWFSDVWSDLRGTGQRLQKGSARERSGAFPFELPWRLIQMYSLQGEVVLDPFAGTGTTLQAALATGRSSIGIELEPNLGAPLAEAMHTTLLEAPKAVERRLAGHAVFVEERTAAGKPPKYVNDPMGMPVMTRQEQQMQLLLPVSLQAEGAGRWCAAHEPVKGGVIPTVQSAAVAPDSQGQQSLFCG